jgi:hypothetical protein
LVGLLQEINQITNNTSVATVEESCRDTCVTSTTSTTNSVNVVIDVGWEIIVDDVGDIGNVKTTSSNSGGDQDWATTVSEHLEGTFTLTLSTITVNGGGREVLVDQEVGEGVSHTLGLDKDQGKTSAVGVENVKQYRALVHIFNIFDLLGDVLGSGTDTANRQEDVVFQEISGEHLDIPREGGREHESLTFLNAWHVLTLNNAADLRLETHVQHTISLIENQVLDVAKGDAATLDQIDKTTRGSNEKITATLDLTKLRSNVGTTINYTWSNP